MEKEVAKWLHQQLGYNAAVDTTLSANCRGNLKGLWEFLIANYKTPEQHRHIQHIIAKHRREQEAARLAPERHQQALQQRQHLKQLEDKATALKRTLASLQAAVHNSTQDAAEQHGEQGLFEQDLQEVRTQAVLLQAAKQRVCQLLPVLQAKLSKLKADAEVAKARCQAAGGNRRLQHVSHQLQQLSSTIRAELMQVVEAKVLHQQQLQQQHTTLPLPAGEQTDSQRGTDQSVPSLTATNTNQQGKIDSCGGQQGLAGAPGPQQSSTWEHLNPSGTHSTSGSLQPLARCSLLSGYSPSESVKSSTMQLLQEAPDLLVTGSSQLAAHSSHELGVILNEAEAALLAPLSWGAAGQKDGSIGVSQSVQQQLQALLKGARGVPDQQAASCPYTLPWTTPWQGRGGMAAAAARQHEGSYQSPEVLVKQRQQTHVQLFVQAKAAKAAAAAADKELTWLLGSTPLLRQGIGSSFDNAGSGSSWEAQLAGLWLRVEGLRAEVALLQQRKALFEQDVDDCLQAEVQLQEKWMQIEAAVSEDQELNHLLWQVAADNMELYAALCSQQEQALGLLRGQLAPCGAAASSCAISSRDSLANEAGLVGKLPVASALPPQRIADEAQEGRLRPAGGTSLATITRLQLAAHQLSNLGRPTTAPKAFATAARMGTGAAAGTRQPGAATQGTGSRGKGVDAAAVSALRALAAVDAVAPARCPAALLVQVAGECEQVRQLQQQLDQLSMLCRGATTSAAQAAQHAEQLQQQVDVLRDTEQQEVLPWLQGRQELVQQQRMYARQEVATDIAHSWDIPAQHLLPKKKYEGWSCSEWLAQIQALHGKKRELKEAAAKAHNIAGQG